MGIESLGSYRLESVNNSYKLPITTNFFELETIKNNDQEPRTWIVVRMCLLSLSRRHQTLSLLWAATSHLNPDPHLTKVGMKEHLTAAEVRPCVAGGKGEGLSAKCQCFFCEARLIKGGLVSDWWPHWTNKLWWGNLMRQDWYETWRGRMYLLYTSAHPILFYACTHLYIYTNA